MQSIATRRLDSALIQPQRAEPRSRLTATPFDPEFEIHIRRNVTDGCCGYPVRRTGPMYQVFETGPEPPSEARLIGRLRTNANRFGSVSDGAMVVMRLMVVPVLIARARGTQG